MHFVCVDLFESLCGIFSQTFYYIPFGFARPFSLRHWIPVGGGEEGRSDANIVPSEQKKNHTKICITFQYTKANKVRERNGAFLVRLADRPKALLLFVRGGGVDIEKEHRTSLR